MSITELEILEAWLWDSANILRGSIDSSDFKNHILRLLFLSPLHKLFIEI
ncbi:type I restriction-modification system subunit M N-terminal domain-containing protein [Marivirga aurantiaca]|nr:type I restriction-modification system subunit M N-terminal domain-containing protein [Marivirga aurantiaca]